MTSRFARIATAALCIGLATAAMAADAPWLESRQDDGEVRFTSRLDDDAFSFRVPGRATAQADDDGFLVATIDDTQFVFHVLWANPDQDSFDAVVDGAQAHARKLGAEVVPSDACAQAQARHREWAVREPATGTRTLVVAFETASGAFAIRVVDDAGKTAAGKLRAACASFARAENDEAGVEAGPGGETGTPAGG